MTLFIARPSNELLLTWYGHTAAGRAKARQQLAAEIRTEGKRVIEENVRTAGRSYRCAAGDHGCSNDGSNCLCECHDPTEGDPMSEPTTTTHASGPATGMPLVAGHCPACGGGSLFLSPGGHVACSRSECPDPAAADDLLHGGPPDPAVEDARLRDLAVRMGHVGSLRREWAAAYRRVADQFVTPEAEWVRSRITRWADAVESGALTPWADQPDPAVGGPDHDGLTGAPHDLPAQLGQVGDGTCTVPVDAADHRMPCARERPCPEHDQPPPRVVARLDPAEADGTWPFGPAQPAGDATVATGPHPDTPTRLALVDRNDDVWWYAPEVDLWRWRTGRQAVYRSRDELESFGEVREVLLVSPSAGRVLDAELEWQAARTQLGRSGRMSRDEISHAVDRADAAERELAAAVDALAGDQPAESAPDLAISTAEAEANVPAMQAAVRAGAIAWDAEAAPEPDSGPGWDRAPGAARAASLAELEEVTAARDRLAADLDAAKGWLDLRDGELVSANEQRDAARAELTGVREELARMAGDLQDRDATLALRTREQDAHEGELGDMRAQLSAAETEVDRLRQLTADSIDPATIPEQRAKNWADWHPEAYCHRCGRPNVWSWFADNAVWNEAEEDGGGILCPVCLVADHERVTGQRTTWRLAPADKSDEVAHLIQSEAAMRHELNSSRAEVKAKELRIADVLRRLEDARDELERLRGESDQGWQAAGDMAAIEEAAAKDRAEVVRLRAELATARRDATEEVGNREDADRMLDRMAASEGGGEDG